MPVLFEHYQEHQQVSNDISFAEFVVIHYFSGNVKDEDYDRDMQLPFKTTDFFSSTVAHAFVPPSFPELQFGLPGAPPSYAAEYTDSFIPLQYLSAIWQPPKSC